MKKDKKENTKKNSDKDSCGQMLANEERQTFNRINEKFRQYWVCLLKIISFYIMTYLVWYFASVYIPGGKGAWAYSVFSLSRGIMFSIDGFVTSLLKTPFNQMCYAINKSDLLSDKQKDYVITRATESNEHCKETMKKFGIISITTELTRVIIKEDGPIKKESFWYPITYISYLIPLFFAAYDIMVIRRELRSVKNSILYAASNPNDINKAIKKRVNETIEN